MSAPEVQRWLQEHDAILSELMEAQVAAAGSAGDLARALDGTSGEDVEGAADLAAGHAENFLAIIRRANRLPPLPDTDTETAFRRALQLFRDGAQAQATAARGSDLAEANRAAVAYQAAGDEALRMAAALRRATDQPPDPRTAGF